MASKASKKLRERLGQLAPWRPARSMVPTSGSSGLLSSGAKRTVHCNEAERNDEFRYSSNVTSTTKYTPLTFLPKALFEQYRRAGYWYFTFMAFLSVTPISPYSAVSVIGPLVFVLTVALLREAWEDAARAAADKEVNARPALIYASDGTLQRKKWRDLRVGDVVKVEDGEFFPADLLLLYSSGPGGVAYVETKDLDGETNLKVRQATDETMRIGGGSEQQQVYLDRWSAEVTCEGPNASLYTFTGHLELPEGPPVSLGPQQLLLRDSSLQNTPFVVGVAIYTGGDTKSAQNQTPPGNKRSRMDRRLDSIIWLMFLLLAVISFVNAAALAVLCSTVESAMFYLRAAYDDTLYDPSKPWAVFGLSLLTSLILYGYLIPLAMYVSLEVIRIVQATLISQDLNMYDEATDKTAKAKSAGLNEELGQVTTILSDKTGTLTCNQMDFFRCTIGGTSFGSGTTEVERAAQRLGIPLQALPSINPRRAQSLSLEFVEDEDEPPSTAKPKPAPEKGYNLKDERLEGGNWVAQPHPALTRRFLEILALCHTAIPEGNVEEGSVQYRAESPDEAAFLVAARRLGFVFYRRTPSTLHVRELHPLPSPPSQPGGGQERTAEGEEIRAPEAGPSRESPRDLSYELLAVLEFSSARKRMSVVVRDPQGKILLLAKGADVAIMARLATGAAGTPPGMAPFVDETARDMTKYGQAGLRTLTLAYREVGAEEYREWGARWLEAKAIVGPAREDRLEELAEELEQRLILVGGTGVEDKLQEGVPDCIERLAQAGIKMWVLTGDKTDTAVNIAYACSLLRAGMERVEVTLDSPGAKDAEEKALTAEGAERDEAEETLKRIVREQLRFGLGLLDHFSSGPEGAPKPAPDPESHSSGAGNLEGVALVIDGRSLAVLSAYPELEQLFLDLASGCESVLCCRVSPKQKATVTRMVRKRLGPQGLCLAIGDGANDVGMIQAAHVGVGISGVEGAQAAMAADYAIAQFRFLERLLLVHGHWCYRRIAITINYSMWKVIILGMMLFYSSAVAFWTGTPMFDEWYSSFYNTLFTAFPIGLIGSMDQDVSASECVRNPQLYQQGQENTLFNWHEILQWMVYALYASLVIFFFPIWIFGSDAIGAHGQPAAMQDVGAAMFTSLVLSANLLLFLAVSYFTWIHHALIWGSIATWFLFVVVYGSLPASVSLNAYHVFVEVLAPSPAFWLMQLLVVTVALLPFFVASAYKSFFAPSDDQIIREASIARPKKGRFRFRFSAPKLPRFPMRSPFPKPEAAPQAESEQP